MNETTVPSASERRSLLDLLWIALAAAAMRLMAYAQLSHAILFNHLLGDAQGYDHWAAAIAAGNGSPARVFYQEPLYPYVLAIVYKGIGHFPGVIFFLQSLVGIGSCLLLYLLARELFSRRAALIAGFYAAGYGLFLFYERQLVKETLAVFCILCATWFLLRAARRNKPFNFVGPGILTGLTILLRGNVYLYVPLLVLWIGWLYRDQPRPQAVLCIVGFLLGVFATLAPVTIRNRVVGHDWVLSSYQAGSNFYIGNNPRANGLYTALKEGREGPPWEEEDAVLLAEQARGHLLKPSQVSSYWFRQGLAFIVKNPDRFLCLVAARLALLWNAQEIPDYIDIHEAAQHYRILELPILNFAWLGPLGLLGLALMVRERRTNAGGNLILVYVGGAIVSAALFYIFARYRMLLIPYLILSGAYAVDWAWGAASRHDKKSLGAATLFIVVAAIFVNVKWVRPFTPGVTYQTLATAYWDAGDFEHAAQTISSAVAASPEQVSPRLFLAECDLRLGRSDEATQQLEEVIRLAQLRADPSMSVMLFKARVLLAPLVAKAGDKTRAQQLLAEAEKGAPNDPGSLVALGNASSRSGDSVTAERWFRLALAQVPDSAVILNNLATLLRNRGRLDEAKKLYDRALAVDPSNPVIRRNRDQLVSQGEN
jgi:4-amino-4-deoxy-L-arabinose transferase-like glycosyltransferase/Flp pilus assembly protein TadD